MKVISNGKPCYCGPGFCAARAGIGYIGFCGGSRTESAPDCVRCGAPHQSPDGCWACSVKGNRPTKREIALAKESVRALAHGLSYDQIFDEQARIHGRTGRRGTFGEAIDELIRRKAEDDPVPECAFHLFGGVTQTEAEAALIAHGHPRCGFKGCDDPNTVMVIVLRTAPTTEFGQNLGTMAACAAHTADLEKQAMPLFVGAKMDA